MSPSKGRSKSMKSINLRKFLHFTVKLIYFDFIIPVSFPRISLTYSMRVVYVVQKMKHDDIAEEETTRNISSLRFTILVHRSHFRYVFNVHARKKEMINTGKIDTGFGQKTCLWKLFCLFSPSTFNMF